MYSARVELDSINTSGNRLTTLVLTYPRMIHSEFNTHRMLSRNAASSRAIPIKKMISAVLKDPAMPVEWGKNQSGMQAKSLLSPFKQKLAQFLWLRARDVAVAFAWGFTLVGVHKQITNRLLEPWMWITVIVSATEWSNFFKQRCHPDAQPEIRKIAEMARNAMNASEPALHHIGQWHMPMIQPGEEEDFHFLDRLKIATGRIARVSYLTHDGKRDPKADIALHDRLVGSGHWSPFEHCAEPMSADSIIRNVPSGSNFVGWRQYRKAFAGESGAS